MSIPTDHPFQPGVRVAIRSGHYPRQTYREAVVEKVYKTGHFLLKGNPTRWRPHLTRWSDAPPRWTADPTGDAWSSTELLLWDETTDKEISEGIALGERRDRLSKIKTQIERLKPDGVADETLDAIEAALARAIIAKAEGKTE